MRFFWNASLSQLSGAVHWDEGSEGPPKGAHGASVAMVFDEILAYPIWRSGVGAFTANLNINLRKMVPHQVGTTRHDTRSNTQRKEGGTAHDSGRLSFKLRGDAQRKKRAERIGPCSDSGQRHLICSCSTLCVCVCVLLVHSPLRFWRGEEGGSQDLREGSHHLARRQGRVCGLHRTVGRGCAHVRHARSR